MSNPNSVKLAVAKHDTKNEFPVQAGRGVTSISKWKLQDPLLKIVANREQKTGDRIEFRNRGTKLKYRHTFESDGSLKKPHKLNFPHFVLIRNYKKKESKNC